MIRFALSFVLALLSLTFPGLSFASAADWMAGAARINITPEQPVWMSGYAGRPSVAQGKLTDLWAKALVLKDSSGEVFTFVSLDLVGIDRPTSLAIRQGVCKRHGIELANISLFTSHTHTGPVVGTNLLTMYQLTDEQHKQIIDFTERLIEQVGKVVDQAFADLEPAELNYGIGEAAFAVNRRENRGGDVRKRREEGNLKGPSDYRVPVFRVQSGGKLKAIVFGYACHATVLAILEWSGDYPGFAQIELETRHPETIAMFTAGCGADQNPLPRSTVELAKAYGKQLADAVDNVLAEPMTLVKGELATRYQEISIRFSELPTIEEIKTETQSKDPYVVGRAQKLLKQWEEKGEIAPDYPYPIQTCRFGDGPTWVIMGGEVVVDYALRIQQEFGDQCWTAGYANDVMAYIPSRRVLMEGGYEGGGSMVIYGLPSPWEADIERKIIDVVGKQINAVATQESTAR